MITKIRCDKAGCSHEVPARFLFEAEPLGADPSRIYEGSCPDHGLFQYAEAIPRQAGVVILPSGSIGSVNCPTAGCARKIRLSFVTRSKEIGVGAHPVTIYQGECPEHGRFRAHQS